MENAIGECKTPSPFQIFGGVQNIILGDPPLLTISSGVVGPATTQNLVVKFDGEICGGVLVENASDDFPSKRSSKISCQTSPEVRHQFRQKLRQLHSGNRLCLVLGLSEGNSQYDLHLPGGKVRFAPPLCRGLTTLSQQGGFPKGWFWRMFPRNENRNEGTFGCSTLSPACHPCSFTQLLCTLWLSINKEGDVAFA